MQIAETLNEGLKRAFMLTITAKDIDALVEAEVTKVAPQMKMPGFRPGKVPANLVRKMHGPALQQEALNTAIQNGVSKLVADNNFRPAMQPSVALADGYEPGKDAAITVELEILPDVPAPVIDGIKLERLTVEVDEALVDEQIDQLLGQQKSFEDATEGHIAATGDLVVMDYLGKVEGEPFDGGKGEGMSVEIGTGRLIPGFEDQLVGVKAGDEKQINVTFPEDYNVDYLKGKPATFDLKITDVRVSKAAIADEDFAKSLGLESLEQLRGLLKGQIEQEHNGLTRTHMKRKLLDNLAGAHDFAVPPSMVEAEFQQIWSQLEHEASHEDDKEAALAEMEGDREEYHSIAERRVRLGLLLSEIGQANGVEITQAEMSRLVAQAAQQYPKEQRDRFMQYVQQEPMAAAQLRAPLYEDKVVDLLFAKAEITDRVVARAELEAEIEAEDGASGHVHGPDCDHGHDEKPKAKKAAAPKKSKAHAEAVAAEASPEPVAEEAPVPAKKAPAKKAPKVEAAAEAPVAEKATAKPKAVKKPASKA
ncbi:trigger factor [Sphingomonas sp.]|uniref:trigger factor n=1 Tax=Sphingomonas sp. TaxID=28214 RepID=UPI0025CDF9F3|nr:trigger factor [Sphingomonas sp.]